MKHNKIWEQMMKEEDKVLKKETEKIAREFLKIQLEKITPGQLNLFKRMYSQHDDRSRSIEEIVDNMPAEKLDWAIIQIDNTMKKIK